MVAAGAILEPFFTGGVSSTAVAALSEELSCRGRNCQPVRYFQESSVSLGSDRQQGIMPQH